MKCSARRSIFALVVSGSLRVSCVGAECLLGDNAFEEILLSPIVRTSDERVVTAFLYDDGRFLSVLNRATTSGTHATIRLIDGCGAVQGATLELDVRGVYGIQAHLLSNGDRLVTTASDSPCGLSIQRFSADGNAMSTPNLVDPTVVCSGETGIIRRVPAPDDSLVFGFTYGWREGVAQRAATIIRKFDRNGDWTGQEFRGTDESEKPIVLIALNVAPSGAVHFVTGAQGSKPGTFNVCLWMLDKDLNVRTEPVVVLKDLYRTTLTSGGLAVDGAANSVIAWIDVGESPWDQEGDRVVAQRFDPAGQPLGDVIDVSGPPRSGLTYQNGIPMVVADADGNFIVYFYLAAQRFNSHGERIGRLVQTYVYPGVDYGLVGMNNRGQFSSAYPLGQSGLNAVRIFDFYAQEFIRGDANESGVVDISDAIVILGYLFSGADGPETTIRPVLSAGDANDDGNVDLSDAIHVIGHLFLGTAYRIPQPYPYWGFDPTG